MKFIPAIPVTETEPNGAFIIPPNSPLPFAEYIDVPYTQGTIRNALIFKICRNGNGYICNYVYNGGPKPKPQGWEFNPIRVHLPQGDQ